MTVARGLYRHHAFDHAATMSFYFFLGSIPLLAFGGLLLGRILRLEGADTLAEPFYRAMPSMAGDLLRTQLREIEETRGTSIAPISLIGFLWLTSNGFHNLMDVFELLLAARPRPWWKQRLIALLWVFVTVIVAGVATGFLLMTNGLFEVVDRATPLPLLLQRGRELLAHEWRLWGTVLVFVLLSTTGLAFFYRFAVVQPKGVRRWVWPGAIVAHLLWAIVTWAFGTYVRTIGDYAVYYGSLATVVVALLWLYLTSLALLVGAEINAQLEGVRVIDVVHFSDE